MDLKEIKQIVDLMKRAALTEFEIEEKDLKLRICRSNGEPQVIMAQPQQQVPSMQQAPAPAAEVESKPDQPEGKVIKSPMVGTFYSTPNPDSPPFVQNGDAVNDETVVCIIEAMKVMNEIKAETSGKITEVLVKSGESVEYGQPLFRVV